ncbi:YidC/Oxa1 family membrane protein insertase [Acetivibrio clariflavus]|uniref:Preprotein translocase subunit YidC n=1 Tax=Acetivibrio clariflavus (strain DSM 19732 / NBRC 101661 / EBR45) TaxID=720554 RepID=G8LUK1_ACECE|nr:YidC/Oxa1 family membrane protein insertase [Acetivibrio clariflavus]AEV70649.1 preprotein translocase subunit YidC [Acetivibrio clariflavus DSM 19732]
MFSFIPKFLGIILNFIYENLAFKNYGLAIILFTIFVKLLLLPLTIKQIKSTAKMQELQPIIQELQRKYKNDTNKLNEELMKLYTEHKYNPASGCLPLLVQIPILFSLIYVIGQPLTYMFGYSIEEIKTFIEAVPDEMKVPGFYAQLGAVNFHNILNMNFLGLDLGAIPSLSPGKLFGEEMLKYLPLLILPILSVTSTILSNKLMMMSTMRKNDDNKNDKSQDVAMAMNRNMAIIAPLMTLWVSFQFPAGLGLYWFTSNVFQIFQQLYINKYIVNKKEVKEG